MFRRRPLPLALVGLILTITSPGLALGADGKPKSPRPLAVQPKPVDGAALAAMTAKARAKAGPQYLALPGPLSPGTGFANTGFGSGGFANNGLRSNLPIIGDPAPICRAACAKAHYTCLSTDDPVDCNPRWAVCTAGCSR